MVCRVKKTKNYTVMSNHHLTNGNLSLKAKGLLSLMLSLPEEWDYTIKGLAVICKEGVDSIGAAIKELEEECYITRQRVRDTRGRLLGTEYIIHEVPEVSDSGGNLENSDFSPKRENPGLDENCYQKEVVTEEKSPKRENPVLDKTPKRDFPGLDNPRQEKPAQDNPVQLNTVKDKKTNILNTNINNSINLSSGSGSSDKGMMDEIDREELSVRIKQQIDYDVLTSDADYSLWINEIYELMMDVMTSRQKEYKVNGSFERAEKIRSRMLSLQSEHIMFVIQSIKDATGNIRNIRNYLLTSLYNSPLTYQTSINAGLNQLKFYN